MSFPVEQKKVADTKTGRCGKAHTKNKTNSKEQRFYCSQSAIHSEASNMEHKLSPHYKFMTTSRYCIVVID